MQRISLLSALVLALAAAPAAAADRDHPAVVELFQSQGCSSCPPANALINRIAGRADILALSFAVTYWDRLGWKDTFAKPEFTTRQWDYARAGGRGNVATPQILVNGRTVLTGANGPALVAALRDADRGHSGPVIAIGGGKVSIGPAAAARPAIIWLVRYNPRTLAVPVRAGENGGRTLPHRNIVHALDQLGSWRGKAASFAVAPDRLHASAVLVQDGRGGRIIAARRL